MGFPALDCVELGFLQLASRSTAATALGVVLLATGCNGDDGDDGMQTGTGSSGDGTDVSPEDSEGNDAPDDGNVDADADDSGGDDSTSSADDQGDDSTGEWPDVDVEPFSDDFEDGDFAGWDVFQGQFANVSVQAGALVFEPTAFSLWFNQDSAGFLSKDIPGNFKVTARVSARSLQNPNDPPAPQYRLGGLMARNGASGSENYAFIVLGADDADVSVETKNTQNGQSTFQGPPWPEGEGELRICRIQSTLYMLIRADGGSWELRDTFERPDLPPTLQVGPVGYANTDPADLRVTYDSIDFANVDGMADCMN